jgi:hypothetical protein
VRIRTQIALLVGGVAVPLIVLATIVTAVFVDRERSAVEIGLRDTVGALSLALDRELVSSIGKLRASAPASPPYPSREMVRSYLSDLSDAEVGALVRGRLDAAPATDRGKESSSA